MRKAEKIKRIVALSDQALNDPNIQAHDSLLETINYINNRARKGKMPKDNSFLFDSFDYSALCYNRLNHKQKNY